ncbi:signal peptide peptidase SppA [Vibrio sagamiensis]|uniref:Protease 4 n=1 Tax=Vibrio sagamiensis NBRC 104589 TaxID=1219064 RepID=A0A511QB45_9VIBR|nr:signal peptide peptidase SppA [Vibrio sagamiensis]PNQ58685.1 signal peptide peptidase SppA [Vibrio agarivorans]GEM74447.1 protease 4 [Vibrio sagamiensis NBRC 104589]
MKNIFKPIGLIFKGIWKVITFIRLALANVLFLVFIAALYFALTYSAPEQPVLEKESALVLNLSGSIVEQSHYISAMDSFTGSAFGGDIPEENVLFDIVDTIRRAKDDPKISGLVLALGNMAETNLTKLRYIAKALNEFKTSEKPIYATGSFYNQSQYYLASYADKIFLAPDGGVMIKGYSAYSMYYKSLLEKLDVSTHVFRVGTYKSAIEPFIRDDMSEAAKESTTRWITQLWSAYVDDVASNRKFANSTLNPTMEELLADLEAVEGDIAQLALNKGLVDELATREQVRKQLIDVFGQDDKHSFNAIDYHEYRTTVLSNPANSDNEIAVVVASGTILDGEQPRGTIGGDTIANKLRQARNDDKVKAVVLRVDSPGGSAFASEVIRNEVLALKESGKPVVVSMSSLAASGGYWISMSADKIIAQPTTLTGSIGIFSVITTFEKSLHKLGINTDGIGTSPFSGDGITTGLSAGAAQAFQLGINHGYKRFTTLVSSSRDIPLTEVDHVAQGHVWTGQDALSFNLVDQMGDFDDAIDAAAQLANLESYDLNWIEEPLSPAELFLQQFMQQVKVSYGVDAMSLVPKSLQPIAKQLNQDASLLQSFNDPKGIYAFCLNCQVQ